MAPEETIITRWPSLRSLTAVSTIRDRIDIRGSRVFSSTMEDVPGYHVSKMFKVDAIARVWYSKKIEIYSYWGYPAKEDSPSLITIVNCFFPFLLCPIFAACSLSENPIMMVSRYFITSTEL